MREGVTGAYPFLELYLSYDSAWSFNQIWIKCQKHTIELSYISNFFCKCKKVARKHLIDENMNSSFQKSQWSSYPLPIKIILWLTLPWHRGLNELLLWEQWSEMAVNWAQFKHTAQRQQARKGYHNKSKADKECKYVHEKGTGSLIRLIYLKYFVIIIPHCLLLLIILLQDLLSRRPIWKILPPCLNHMHKK